MDQTVKCYFMSGPHSDATKRRTWLVREPGEPSFLVRVFPNSDAPGRTLFVCDCGVDRCPHVHAASIVDGRKFKAKEGNS